jgi:hypothetical protein
MSRREYKTINRRLQQGRLTSVKEGKYLAPGQPFGYTRTKVKNGKGMTLIPHPEQAAVIKLIFDLYTKGENGKRYGLHALATKLNNMGIPTSTGKPWGSNSVNVILNNPVYIGKIRWNNRPKVKKVVDGVVKIERPQSNPDNLIITEGMHPAIIDIDTFEAAADIIKNNRANPNPHGLETKNPLSGIIECALCGRKMSRLYYPGGEQVDKLICINNACKNMSSSINLVETEILRGLELLLERFKVQSGDSEEALIDTSILEKSLKVYESEQEALGKQLDKTHDLLEQGVYNTETFLSRTKTITEKIKELDQKKTEISNQIKTIQLQQDTKKNIIPKIDNVINSYHSTVDVAVKNEMLKQILVKVTYLKTKRSTKKNPSGDMELILEPRI